MVVVVLVMVVMKGWKFGDRRSRVRVEVCKWQLIKWIKQEGGM